MPSRVIWKAALLTRMSSVPSSETARSTSERQWASSEMSPGARIVYRPLQRSRARAAGAV